MLRQSADVPSRCCCRWSAWAVLAFACVGVSGCMVEISRTSKGTLFKPGSEIENDETTQQVRIEMPDGTIELLTATPAHFVSNLRNCIVLGETDLIFKELISTQTKELYESRDLDPHEAVNWIMTNQRDILILLNRMGNPMLNSADVTWEAQGQAIRFRIYTPIREQMRFTVLDVIRENGEFRLLLIS